MPVSGGPLRPLSDRLDRAVLGLHLAPGGKAFDAIIEDDRQIYALRLPIDGGAPTRLLTEVGVTTDLAVGGDHTAVLVATDRTAPEVHALEQGKLRRLSHHNDALLAEVELGPVEDLSFTDRDGIGVPGF